MVFSMFRSTKREAVGRVQDAAKSGLEKVRGAQNQARKGLYGLQNGGEKFFRDRRRGASRLVGDMGRGARYVASGFGKFKGIRGETNEQARTRRLIENRNRRKINAVLADERQLSRQERDRQIELSRLKTNRKYGLNRRRTESKYGVKNALKKEISSLLNKYTTFEMERMVSEVSGGKSIANVLHLPLENVLMKNRINTDELVKMKSLVNNMKNRQDVNDLKLLYNKLPAELKVQDPVNNRQKLAKHIKNALPRVNTASQQRIRRATGSILEMLRDKREANERLKQVSGPFVAQRPTTSSNGLNTASVIRNYEDVNRIINNGYGMGPLGPNVHITKVSNVKDVETVIRYLLFHKKINRDVMKSRASNLYSHSNTTFKTKEGMRVRLLKEYA